MLLTLQTKLLLQVLHRLQFTGPSLNHSETPSRTVLPQSHLVPVILHGPILRPLKYRTHLSQSLSQELRRALSPIRLLPLRSFQLSSLELIHKLIYRQSLRGTFRPGRNLLLSKLNQTKRTPETHLPQWVPHSLTIARLESPCQLEVRARKMELHHLRLLRAPPLHSLLVETGSQGLVPIPVQRLPRHHQLRSHSRHQLPTLKRWKMDL